MRSLVFAITYGCISCWTAGAWARREAAVRRDAGVRREWYRGLVLTELEAGYAIDLEIGQEIAIRVAVDKAGSTWLHSDSAITELRDVFFVGRPHDESDNGHLMYLVAATAAGDDTLHFAKRKLNENKELGEPILALSYNFRIHPPPPTSSPAASSSSPQVIQVNSGSTRTPTLPSLSKPLLSDVPQIADGVTDRVDEDTPAVRLATIQSLTTDSRWRQNSYNGHHNDDEDDNEDDDDERDSEEDSYDPFEQKLAASEAELEVSKLLSVAGAEQRPSVTATDINDLHLAGGLKEGSDGVAAPNAYYDPVHALNLFEESDGRSFFLQRGQTLRLLLDTPHDDEDSWWELLSAPPGWLLEWKTFFQLKGRHNHFFQYAFIGGARTGSCNVIARRKRGLTQVDTLAFRITVRDKQPRSPSRRPEAVEDNDEDGRGYLLDPPPVSPSPAVSVRHGRQRHQREEKIPRPPAYQWQSWYKRTVRFDDKLIIDLSMPWEDDKDWEWICDQLGGPMKYIDRRVYRSVGDRILYRFRFNPTEVGSFFVTLEKSRKSDGQLSALRFFEVTVTPPPQKKHRQGSKLKVTRSLG